MSKDIAVDPELLRDHAAKVDQLASEVGEAVAAVQSVNLSGGAFGVLCSGLVALVQPAVASTAQMITEGQNLLSRTGTELRAAVSDWEQVESDVVDAIRALEKAMD